MFRKFRAIPAEWAFLDHISPEIDYVIDVGANEGSYVSRIREYVGRKDLQATLFEPQSGLLSGSKESRNLLSTIVTSAVGSRCEGKVTLHVAANNGNSSSLFEMEELHSLNAPDANYTGELIVAQQITLDCHFKRPIFQRALLKIDTQGNEMEVLKGSLEILPRVSAISLEISFQSLYKGAPLGFEVFEYLHDLGFLFFGMDPIFKEKKSGAWLQADAYFARHIN